jgi:hypothetical protein
MIFRKVVETDFFQIKKLYKQGFNSNLKKNIYNYFYFDQNLNSYFSIIAENKRKIVAHHAIIQNKYLFKNKNIIIGYSSGSIVSNESFGLYPYILQKSIENFKGDIIITFPNKNSQGFFTKIFNFETINQNYFLIDCSKIEYLKSLKDIECKSNFIRTKEYINWRIDKHPINKYKKISINNTTVIYKEYHSNEIDIMYVNYFNDEFIKILIKLLENYKRINIIHWDRNYIKKLGFEEQKNNIFVYKNISNRIKISAFECQMIDSDIF